MFSGETGGGRRMSKAVTPKHNAGSESLNETCWFSWPIGITVQKKEEEPVPNLKRSTEPITKVKQSMPCFRRRMSSIELLHEVQSRRPFMTEEKTKTTLYERPHYFPEGFPVIRLPAGRHRAHVTGANKDVFTWVQHTLCGCYVRSQRRRGLMGFNCLSTDGSSEHAEENILYESNTVCKAITKQRRGTLLMMRHKSKSCK